MTNAQTERVENQDSEWTTAEVPPTAADIHWQYHCAEEQEYRIIALHVAKLVLVRWEAYMTWYHSPSILRASFEQSIPIN